jgi:hypothetical protein
MTLYSLIHSLSSSFANSLHKGSIRTNILILILIGIRLIISILLSSRFTAELTAALRTAFLLPGFSAQVAEFMLASAGDVIAPMIPLHNGAALTALLPVLGVKEFFEAVILHWVAETSLMLLTGFPRVRGVPARDAKFLLAFWTGIRFLRALALPLKKIEELTACSLAPLNRAALVNPGLK